MPFPLPPTTKVGCLKEHASEKQHKGLGLTKTCIGYHEQKEPRARSLSLIWEAVVK